MKKYMIVPLIISLFVTFHTSAMEVEWETDEEFIARTRVEKNIPEECRIFCKRSDLRCERWSFCPDKTKLVAVAQYPYKIPTYAMPLYYLMIIDLHKNNDTKIKYQEQLFYYPVNNYYSVNDYDRVALSSGGSMIAMFHAKRERRNDKDYCEYILQIRGVDEAKGRKIDFPYSFYPEIIAFNKQGTLLIAHGKDGQKDIHQIFPLKNC